MSTRVVPYLRLLVSFALGIFFGAWFDRPVIGLEYCLLLGGILTPILAILKFGYRYRWIFGVFASLLLFGFGFWYTVHHNELRQLRHFSTKVPAMHYFVGTIYEAPVPGARLKIPVQVEAVGISPDSLAFASGNLLIFLESDDDSIPFHYGDRIAIRATARPNGPPVNPYAFDYAHYLHFQNIHFQAFAKKDSVLLLSQNHGYTLWRMAFAYRDQLLALLRRHFPTQDEYAVASALLVGYKEDLSDDLRTAYAETGSMHALAVSGSHVSMLYAGLLFLLRKLPLRGRRGRMLETLLVFCVIWAFTFLTGATASVLRASVMFSVYLVGQSVLGRNASVWNVLGASAFGLLLYNPYFLFDAGFQLSYAAVAGMVFFYPHFYKLSPTLPKWADAAWQMVLVGCTAQLGTLPLSLYYFHQFPIYFWLSGWFVILGGAVILGGGAALIVLDLIWPQAGEWLGTALYWMVWCMNKIIVWIQELPGSVISGVWITAWVSVCLYVVVGLLGAAMARQKSWHLFTAASIMLCLGVYRNMRRAEERVQHQAVIYSINKYSLMDFFDGQSVVAISDSLSRKQLSFTADANRWAGGLHSLTTLYAGIDTNFTTGNIWYSPPFIQYFDKKIAVVDNAKWMNTDANVHIAVDILVLQKNPPITVAACRQRFPHALVIFDASNTWKQIARWKAECIAAGWPYYDVREQGAYVLQW